MQFVLFLFNVNTVNTRNTKCIRLNGTNVDTVDTIIDTCIHSSRTCILHRSVDALVNKTLKSFTHSRK